MSGNTTDAIDVDEFLGLVADEVVRINDLDEEDVTVTLDDSIVDDLELDSLGNLELILRIQSRYGVSISEEDAKSAKTIRELLALIERG